MECEKCNSMDLTILNEETIIYFECNECGCEFEEVI